MLTLSVRHKIGPFVRFIKKMIKKREKETKETLISEKMAVAESVKKDGL